MIMNRQAQLREWAEKVVKYYNKTAPEIDLSFYQFQKSADFVNECDLLLIGLNPGGGGTYASQYEKPKDPKKEPNCWHTPTHEGKSRFMGNRMTVDGFLDGNPVWNKEWNNAQWSILKGLSLIGLDKDTLDGLKNWQYINYIPFSTNHIEWFYERAAKKKVPLENFVRITTKYIHLLSPKRILFMGTANGIDQFSKWRDSADLGEFEILLGLGGRRLIIKTSLCGIPTFAIPHPSYANWPVEARNEMAHMISLFLEGKEDEIEAKNLDGRPRPNGRHIVEEVFNTLVNNLGEKHYLNAVQNGELYMFQINDIIQIRITTAEKGYIGIRHANYDGKKKYNTGAYVGTDEYRNKLGELGFKVDFKDGEDVWLGRKSFAEYGSAREEIAKAIESDIDVLEKEPGEY